MNLRGSSARTVPARGRPEVKAVGGLVASRCSTRKRCSSWWVPVRRRIAEVGRTPSGSEKRDDRCRLGRKPGSHTEAREREPDHRWSLRRVSAGAHQWQKGGGSSKLGHPHHVRAGAIGERDAVSFVLRHGRVRVATADGRHPGSGMRTPFTRPPRNRSWRPSSQSMGLAKSGPRPRARRRRQGCQRRAVSFARDGRKRRHVVEYRAPKWEARREARFSPVSSASGGPEPPGARFARLRTGGTAHQRRRWRG